MCKGYRPFRITNYTENLAIYQKLIYHRSEALWGLRYLSKFRI